ncbi:MAG: aminotransferase class III-fold pyridoxal phosphate-dependent enzyme [Gemmatimonadota bacterium]|nr:aminotransferase class III-fold pyridoxal phosphate-dependent enzyme [Gemmatimonadota bacterium]
MNTARSTALFDASSRYLAMGVSSGMRRAVTSPPLFFDRAEGPYYYDVDGNRLLDYTLAWGPLILGSNHPELNAAVTAAVRKSYTLGAQHPGEVAFAKLLVETLPGVDQVIFSNTGSEAVQAALRLARAATGRVKFVKFEGHYHGWLNNILVSYHESDEALGAPEAPRVVAACGGQPAAEFADTVTLPWNRFDLLEDLFATRGGEIAAVITEPVLANSGSIMPGEGFLKGMVDLCRSYGAVSIFDEVITGFRLALGGAREYFNVIPDLSVYAKALAGGFTLSAVAGSRRMFDVLRNGATIHAGTYNGSTVNLAAGLATVRILGANPLAFRQMHGHGYAIRQAIESAAACRGIPACISGAGTVFNVHFGVLSPPAHYRELKKTDMALYNRFRAGMLEEGIQLLPDGRWYVGLTHGDEELNLVCAAIRSVVAEL